MLSDWRDLGRLKGALRPGAALAHPMMRGMTDATFPASYTPRVAAIARPGFGRALRRGTLAGLDVAGPARRTLIETVLTGGIRLADLAADDAALTRYVSTNVGGTWHPTCSPGCGAFTVRCPLRERSRVEITTGRQPRWTVVHEW